MCVVTDEQNGLYIFCVYVLSALNIKTASYFITKNGFTWD